MEKSKYLVIKHQHQNSINIDCGYSQSLINYVIIVSHEINSLQ
jgi:hypothetical protein